MREASPASRCLSAKAARARSTVEAMRSGAGVIYQATFLDGQWRGRADFLIRVETPSSLGPWSYEVVDTKLARSTKAGAVVQLCFYSDLLSRIQNLEPQSMHVVLGGGTNPEPFPVQRYIAYYRKIRSEYDAAWKAGLPTYPEPTDHCKVCSWYTLCNQRRHDDDACAEVTEGATECARVRRLLAARHAGRLIKNHHRCGPSP